VQTYILSFWAYVHLSKAHCQCSRQCHNPKCLIFLVPNLTWVAANQSSTHGHNTLQLKAPSPSTQLPDHQAHRQTCVVIQSHSIPPCCTQTPSTCRSHLRQSMHCAACSSTQLASSRGDSLTQAEKAAQLMSIHLKAQLQSSVAHNWL
jgi:hypothetical protein